MTIDLFADHPFKGRATKEDLRRVSYGLPPIPITGWTAPTSFPRLDTADILCIDCETWDPELLEKGPGWGRGAGHIVGIAVGTRDARWYFPMRHTVGTGNMPVQAVLDWCRETFSNPNQPKVFANAQYDLGWLKHEGVEVAGEIIDVQIAEPLLDEHAKSYSLDTLAVKYLGEHKVDSILYDWSFRAYGGKAGRPQAANIYRCPPSLVGPYAEGDVDLPLRIWEQQKYQIEQQGLMNIFKIESQIPRILVGMRIKGVRVDLAKAERARTQLSDKIKEIGSQIKIITGESVDLWAADSIARAFDKVGIPYGKTPTGKPSFTSEFLEHHEAPLAKMIRQARKYDKAINTFIDGYVINMQSNGRVHGQFHQLRGDEGGTVVGRFCVTGDTVIETSRGKIRIDQFEPDGKTTVMSHTGKQQRVLKRIFKGKEKTFIICLNNGATIQCTANHRVLTPDGWKRIGQLSLNSEVYTYERNNTTSKRSDYAEELRSSLFRAPKNEHGRHCESSWNQLSHYFHNLKRRCTSRTTETRKSDTLFSIQKRREKCNVGKTRSRTSQLQRNTNIQNRRVFFNIKAAMVYGASWIKACLSTSGSILSALWFNRDTKRYGSTPFRWKRSEQRHSQFSIDVPQSASTCALPYRVSRVQSVIPMGEEYIWDIEVEHDHSYLAGGMIHHNSSSLPNLENIPARDPEIGALVRGLFLPEEGQSWATLDFSQIQFRIMVHYAMGQGAEEARQKYLDDPTTDYHNMTQSLIFETTGITLDRKPVKNINFGLAFTMGVDKLARELGLSVDEAVPLIDAYHAGVPFVRHTSDAVSNVAATRGYITGILGRRHRFPFWEPRMRKLRGAVKLSQNREEVEAMMRALGEKTGPRDTVRAFTHLGLNRLAQDGEGSTMKKALVDCYNQGLFDALGFPLNIVHDDVSFSNPGNEEAMAEVKHIMETAVKWKVPILVEREDGPNWGDLK